MIRWIDDSKNNTKEWELKKTTEMSTIKTKKYSEFSKSFPVLCAEHVFPDCDDPELILKCLNEYRFEWDNNLEVHDELTQYTNSNTKVYRILNKAVLNTAQREFVEKKVWIKNSDLVKDGEEIPEEDQSDIYLLISSVPDELYPFDSKYVRGKAIMSVTRFGKRKDGQPGCYF